jgi:hypothetical protein
LAACQQGPKAGFQQPYFVGYRLWTESALKTQNLQPVQNQTIQFKPNLPRQPLRSNMNAIAQG